MVQVAPEEERVHLKIKANDIDDSSVNAPALEITDIYDSRGDIRRAMRQRFSQNVDTVAVIWRREAFYAELIVMHAVDYFDTRL
jgi:hypothetical protein